MTSPCPCPLGESCAADGTPVFGLRLPSGVVEWRDAAGALVPTALVGVEPPADLAVHVQAVNSYTTGASADAPTTQETFFNVSATPDVLAAGTVFIPESNGYGASATAPLSGACGGRDTTMTWHQLPACGVTMSYGSNNLARPNAGGIIASFSSPATGPITFPANPAPMTVGSQRISNVLANGMRMRITMLAGAADGNGARAGDVAICSTPAGNVGFHLASVNGNDYRFHFDFIL